MRLTPLALAALLVASPLAAAETWREPATGMEFVSIPKGCFMMGVPDDAFRADDANVHQRARETEMPEHEVCVDQFWLGRFEVRLSDWQKVMGKGRAGARPDAPAAGITWEEANAFVRRLSTLAGTSGRFRLPTEAEWEYACRAGEKARTRIPYNDDLNDKAWYSSPYDADFSGVRIRELQPVGKKQANAFGLHDMLGNVWEWVQDSWRQDAYTQHTLYNPVVTGSPERYVIRGGSLHTDRRMTRCEVRGWLPAISDHATVGLRVVRTR